MTLVRPVATDTPFMDHSKNELESAPNFPPPVYAPEVVARAILHAAEHPQRDVYIGNGKLLSRLEQNAPRPGGLAAPPLHRPDNRQRPSGCQPSRQLHEADSSRGGAGHAHGAYPGVVLQHSLYTRASQHPVATTAARAGRADGVRRCAAAADRAVAGAAIPVPHEPVAGQARHLFQRAVLLEQVARAGHHHQLVLALQSCRRGTIEPSTSRSRLPTMNSEAAWTRASDGSAVSTRPRARPLPRCRLGGKPRW